MSGHEILEQAIYTEGRRVIREALEVWQQVKQGNPIPDGMTLNAYQQAAQRTSNTHSFSAKIENGLFGLAGEVGELHDHYKKYMYQQHDFDKEHLKKELGDVLWYVAELACGLDATLEEIALLNIAKLQARYPAGFEADRSMHRADGDD